MEGLGGMDTVEWVFLALLAVGAAVTFFVAVFK
jgi:hypothetical protein